jgi:4-hydroxybenzoyl-CoA thioesterase
MGQEFVKKEKVRFQHVDYAGIVFYPRFLEMLNCLVEDWFEEALHRPFSTIHETNGIPTVDLKIQFRKAARLGDELSKSLWVKKLGGSSIVCGFRFLHSDGSTCLEGEVTLVNVAIQHDRSEIRSEQFSDAMKAAISPFVIN